MTNASVSYASRFSAFMFGSPSFRRARGGCEASIVPQCLRDASWQNVRNSVPVYAIDPARRGGPNKLPRIWLSEPAYDGWMGNIDGRDLVSSYPDGKDEGGMRAFSLAEGCLGEAVSYAAEGDRVRRVECFRAAEILYLHAVERGCVEAMTKLGVLYRDDACEGSYWNMPRSARADVWAWCQKQAVRCFTQAAAAGSAEACWLLGDLMIERNTRIGAGRSALAWYERAVELSGDDEAAFGNAALRMARACERGIDCEQSFEQALVWYERALEALEEATDNGGWYWKRPCIEARNGVRRMRQEMAGCY